MKKVKIITDSASDITREMSKELDIHVLPLTISFGEDEYLDFVELTADEFTTMLKTRKEHPKTSMVSTQHVREAIEHYSKEYDEVLYIATSSEISGTYNGAVMAAEQFREETGSQKVTIYNSKTFSMGQAMLVKLASDMASIGKNVSSIIERLNELRANQRCYFVLDNLAFTRAGGRITAAEALLGTILDVKPIFEINREGKPSVVSKVRGINRTFDRITDLIAKEADRLSEVWYVHCDGQHFIERLEKVVQDRFKPAKSYFNKARGCIGSHSGPGLFGIAYIL